MRRDDFEVLVAQAKARAPHWFELERVASSERDVADLEAQLGIRLPLAYRDFVTAHGAGLFAFLTVLDQRAAALDRRPARDRDEAQAEARRVGRAGRAGSRRGHRGQPDGEPRAMRPGHGRRKRLASHLPRHAIALVDAEREGQGCRRIGFEFRPGGFYVLVKRIARNEVIVGGTATVVAPPAPATSFLEALLHTSTVAHLLTSKFARGVPRPAPIPMVGALRTRQYPWSGLQQETAFYTTIGTRPNGKPVAWQ